MKAFKCFKTKYTKKYAFTLAEVLITVGIIGVVASMTIPSLLNKIQDREFKESAKKAYTTASQVVQQMYMDNGGDLSSFYTIRLFKPTFMTYFKVQSDYGWYKSGVTELTQLAIIYKNLAGGTIFTNSLDDGQFITADGMFWMIENAGAQLFVTVDVNGYTKKPNVYGRDVFSFQLLNNKLYPMGAAVTLYGVSSYCNRKSNIANQGLGCMYNVLQGIDY